jgi:arylsulfatase
VANYFDPFSLVDGTNAVASVPKGFYLTDAIAEHATACLQDFKRADKPFFLYVAFTSPHWPIQSRPEELAKYKDTYKMGWDAMRAARYRRQVVMGLFQPDQAVLTPRARLEAPWSGVTDKDWQASRMKAHAAMVDRMDQDIGKILAALRENGQLDNTLLFFLSDNGASPEEPRSGGFDRPTETRDGRHNMYGAELERKGVAPGPETTAGSIGPMWANAANTPFRYWKAETYEGGICTPLIVHWPAAIKAHGEFRRQPGHIIDLMATILDVTATPFPKEFHGHPTIPPQGRSLRLAFEDRPLQRDGLFWECLIRFCPNWTHQDSLGVQPTRMTEQPVRVRSGTRRTFL